MGSDSSHPSASSVTHSATAACVKPTAGVVFETCPAYSSHVAETQMFPEAKLNVFSEPYSLKTAGRQNNP